MIVSTNGRYALRVMIDLAEHQSEKYVPLKEVAARQEISEKYLENILKVLVQNGFLEGLRGKGGGYRLTRSPDQYTVGEILMLKAVLHQHLEDVFEIFFRDLLPGSDLFEGDILFGLVLGQIDHHAQCIAPFGGHDHNTVLPLLVIK